MILDVRSLKSSVTLALVGRGHWGTTYKKTIDGMLGIILPDKFIFGKNYKENLKKINPKEIDGVIIAATTSAHFEIAKYLISRGFNTLLIEKPLTQTLSQAEKLEAIVNKIPQAKVLVGHLMLYDPAWKSMKRASKELGKVIKINYTALKGPPIKKGTILQDAGPHPIYLFMDLFGKPKKIVARKKRYDNVELILEFSNGVSGTAMIGAMYPRRIRQIEIVGEKGKLILNEFVNPRQLLHIYQGKIYKLRFPTKVSSLEKEIREFMSLIVGKESRVPLSSGIEIVRLIDLAKKSLSKNGAVKLL